MKRLLSALLAAVVLSAPLHAMAQTAEPAAPAAEAPAPGEAPASSTGVNTLSGDQEGEEHAAAGGHATPHYPLKKPEHMDWSFAGPFGTWDIGQLQRGMKVYREVCSSCHSLNLVSFRNLEALGYNEAQIRALAAEYQVQDGPDSSGDMFERPGIPTDHFPAPFPNAEAAAASNGGAHPPDFSLIAKARSVERGFPAFVFDIFTQYAEGGPDYIHALLTGYGEEPPAGTELQPGTHYNPYFIASSALAMAQPISDGQVTYEDGSPETIDQYSRDISAFLMWAAEPHMVERKSLGFVVMIFLVVFAAMLYAVKRRVWAKIPH